MGVAALGCSAAIATPWAAASMKGQVPGRPVRLAARAGARCMCSMRRRQACKVGGCTRVLSSKKSRAGGVKANLRTSHAAAAARAARSMQLVEAG